MIMIGIGNLLLRVQLDFTRKLISGTTGGFWIYRNEEIPVKKMWVFTNSKGSWCTRGSGMAARSS
jgi:hypothetical protein